MPLHARERILEALKNTLINATQAGARVYRTRVYPHETLPALEVSQGDDGVLDDGPQPAWDRHLTVYVDTTVALVADPIEALLNEIAREVHVALLADVTQGESAVIDTMPLGDEEPTIIETAEQTAARMRMIYRIHYRTAIADPAL